MSKYLLIESKDPFSTHAVQEHVELAAALKRAGIGGDALFRAERRAALPAGADGETLHEAIAAGIEVLADDFSLRERGIADADLARGVQPPRRSICVVERLADAWKVMFL